MMKEPIVVFIGAETCPHCVTLSKIWDNVKKEMLDVYPNLRFYETKKKTNSEKYNYNVVPKYLDEYNAWYPMILLIPGNVWDGAMNNLGPNSNFIIKDGVIIMNGVWEGNKIKHQQKYDTRTAKGFADWLKDSLKDSKFKAIQNNNDNGVPTFQQTGNALIQPMLSGITKPPPNNSSYVIASSHNKAINNEESQDICAMRIISRRK